MAKQVKTARKTTFKKYLKELAEKNGINPSNYTEEDLYSKLERLKREKKLKGVKDFNYLQTVCALWWVNETF